MAPPHCPLPTTRSISSPRSRREIREAIGRMILVPRYRSTNRPDTAGSTAPTRPSGTSFRPLRRSRQAQTARRRRERRERSSRCDTQGGGDPRVLDSSEARATRCRETTRCRGNRSFPLRQVSAFATDFEGFPVLPSRLIPLQRSLDSWGIGGRARRQARRAIQPKKALIKAVISAGARPMRATRKRSASLANARVHRSLGRSVGAARCSATAKSNITRGAVIPHGKPSNRSL